MPLLHTLKIFVVSLGALALIAGRAAAHEPVESTKVARLQHGRLEMVVTLSPQMAGALMPGR